VLMIITIASREFFLPSHMPELVKMCEHLSHWQRRFDGIPKLLVLQLEGV
jgi:hypothetical protein